jgi:tetratricopeptide (TPR) repeat protein
MTNPLAEKIGIADRLEQLGDRVRVLVVAANPLGSSPLKLDHEVKTIQEALRRSRNRDNFVVEYRLAATPSDLRRALLDFKPHVLHFSGHGSGQKGLLFVSDESAGAIYRSDTGEVRSSNSDEIRYVAAQPLANLLKLCEKHLECVVLNACYSDVQGNAISANIPFTIGMRDEVADHVAIKFSQGFYDAIGAGENYENAFAWGKVAIEFDLADGEVAKILVLRKKEPSVKRNILNLILPIAISITLGGYVFNLSLEHKPIILLPTQTPLANVDRARDYFTQGKKYYKSGAIDKAIAYYNIAIENNPNPSEFYFYRGNARYERNDKRGAIEDYQQVIKRNPKDLETYYRMGVTMSELGDYKGAISAFNQAIKLKSDNPNIYTFRGNAKYNLGQEEEAIKDYEIAINIDPNFAPAYSKLGLAKFTLGKKDVAISQYTKAISLQYDFAEPYVGRGDVQRSLGNLKEAISDYNMAIQLKPDYADAFVGRGLANYDFGDKNQALLDYEKAIEVNRNWGIRKLAFAYNNRGIAKSDLGDKQGAIADYNEAIRLNPNFATAYYNRGLIKKVRREQQEALADFQKASELYQQQGNTEGYNDSRNQIKQLGG